MKQIVSSGWLVVLACGALACGSTKYYQVKDPATGTTYYSEKVDKESGGAVKLTDAKTGASVTIQNSEVTEVSEQTYKQGLAAAAAPAAAPATAPADAPATTPPPATPK
jgi:hypothetical protein